LLSLRWRSWQTTTASACDSGSKYSLPRDVNAFEVDGAWLCNQTFALCTTAPCVPSPTDPNISVCNCVVVNGYSIGFKTCTDRAQSGKKVRSAFSTVNVNANLGVLSCPSGVPWATPDLPATVQYRKRMNLLGQPVNFPKTCPAPHP
jgi:hypothetical protein